MNNIQMIEFLDKKLAEYTKQGYVGTIELFIQDLKEEELKVEAQRLTMHTD